MTPEEQKFARANNLHKPMPEGGFRRPAGEEDALDLAEREIIPEAMVRGTHNSRPIVAVENAAIDAMEPEDLSVDVDSLSAAEVREAAEDFEVALRWALIPPPAPGAGLPMASDHHLVQIGKRTAVLIAAMHGKLGQGLPIETELARGLIAAYPDRGVTEAIERLRAVGQIYGRCLEWVRRTNSISNLGERLQMIAYELRPDLIDEATLEKLGEAKNKTRQATNKKSNCLRDTFDGLRALVMRSDFTRLKCKLAQLGLGNPVTA